LQDKHQISDEEIKTLTSALLKREDIRQQDIGIQEKAQNKIESLQENKKLKQQQQQKKLRQQQKKELHPN